MGLHEVITALILINNKVKVKVTQLCPTLCDPMDYIVHGILHGIFSRDQTQVSCIAGVFFIN